MSFDPSVLLYFTCVFAIVLILAFAAYVIGGME